MPVSGALTDGVVGHGGLTTGGGRLPSAVGDRRLAGGSDRCGLGRRRPRSTALRRISPVPPDSTSSSIRSERLEQLGQPIDQAEQLGVTAGNGVGGVDRGAARRGSRWRRTRRTWSSSVIGPTAGR